MGFMATMPRLPHWESVILQVLRNTCIIGITPRRCMATFASQGTQSVLACVLLVVPGKASTKAHGMLLPAACSQPELVDCKGWLPKSTHKALVICNLEAVICSFACDASRLVAGSNQSPP